MPRSGRCKWALLALLTSLGCGNEASRSSNPDLDATATTNACGGTAPIAYQGSAALPGARCGPCRDGHLVCASEDLLACVAAFPANACDDAGDAPPDASFADGDAPPDASFADATTTPDASEDAEPGWGDLDAGDFDAGPGWLLPDASVDAQAFDGGAAPSVTCMDLPAGDLVLDSLRTVLYASVTNAESPYANTVVRIDPSTATVTGTVFVGNQPDALAVSDDGASLYVGEDGTSSVSRVALASGALDPPVGLAPDVTYGPCRPRQIVPVPGSATRYVVGRNVPGLSAGFDGVALYDRTTLLGTWNHFTGPSSLAFVSSTTLAGYDGDDSGYDLYQLQMTLAGPQLASDVPRLITGLGVQIASQGGWVFATSGQTADGVTSQPVGQYPASGPVWPAPNGTDVWFLQGTTLVDCDRATFLTKRSYAFPAAANQGTASVLLGWAPASFAFLTPTSVCIALLR